MNDNHNQNRQRSDWENVQSANIDFDKVVRTFNEGESKREGGLLRADIYHGARFKGDPVKESEITENNNNVANLVKRQAQKNPDKCAITDGNMEISYSVLECAASRFAKHLIEVGCRPSDRVVLFGQKQALLIVGILGIFKSASIHVPLDPRMPARRLRYVLEDILPKVILTDEDLLPTVQEYAPTGTKIILTDELQTVVTASQTNNDTIDGLVDELPKVKGGDVAYCLYTSGSTGRPKGVLIRHAGLIDFFEGAGEFYDVDEHSRCASFSPFHFDASVIDMFFPLYQGAWLYVYSDIVVPDLLFEVIEEKALTHFSAFGMMLGLIAQASKFDQTILPTLQTVLTGGDVPDVKTVQKWLVKNTGVKVINGYGPTEATCAVAAHVIQKIEPDRRKLYPIGKAFKQPNSCWLTMARLFMNRMFPVNF